MPKRVVFLLILLTLIACLLSYKFGSAPVAHAQSLPAAPATWSLWDAGASPGVTVTKAAGGAGVQHVVTCVIGTFSNSGGSYTPTLTLWNGNNNTGTIVLQWTMAGPTTGNTSVNLCGLNVVGSANTPMALSIGAQADQFVTLGLIG